MLIWLLWVNASLSNSLRLSLKDLLSLFCSILFYMYSILFYSILIISSSHMRCLRNILHIRWQDKASDTEVLKQADLPSVITVMRKAQLRWTTSPACQMTAFQSSSSTGNSALASAQLEGSESATRTV